MADPPTPELLVAPDRGGYRVTVAVENNGTSAIDPGVRESSLLVDGKPSMTWGFAMANGAGTTSERRLEPGERVAVERILPIADLGGVGEHELVAEIGGRLSRPVRTHIEE